MLLLLAKILIGSAVGVLVGLSGFGGGVILLPILIIAFGASPLMAVGSDALFNVLTKIGAAYLHWRLGTVNWNWVCALSAGSLPGSFAGVCLLSRLRTAYGDGVNDILRILIGVLLVLIPLLMLLQKRIEHRFSGEKLTGRSALFTVAAIGFGCGILVGLSSVGSGSIVMLLMLIFLPCTPAMLVGTDTVHAVALTGFTSILQFRLGNVDPGLVIPLVAGSIPGALLGVRFAKRLPGQWLKRGICVLLVVTGAGMIWK